MKLTTSIIEKYFDKFNEMYFDNKLERSFPCRVTKSIRVGGFVTILVKESKVLKFSISEKFAKDEDYLSSIIQHEMIHVYIAQNKIHDNIIHGYYFCRKMNDLNKRFGLKIEIQMQKETSKVILKEKRVGIIEVIGKGILPFSEKLSVKEIKKYYSFRNIDIKIGFTTNKNVQKFRVFQKKTIMTFSRYYYYSNYIREEILSSVEFI